MQVDGFGFLILSYFTDLNVRFLQKYEHWFYACYFSCLFAFSTVHVRMLYLLMNTELVLLFSSNSSISGATLEIDIWLDHMIEWVYIMSLLL